MSNPGMRLTRAGKKILAQGLLGDEIHFTKIAFGDADFDYATENLQDLTALKSWKLDLPIIDRKLNGDGTVTIVGLCTNFYLTQGFRAKEIGIFAIDQATGTEILYAYRNAGEEYSFIPAKTGPVTKSVRYAYQIEIDDAPNVTFDINFGFAYVSQEDFKAHVESESPHPQFVETQKLARENRQIIQCTAELPFDANLIIFEDFIPPRYIDAFKVQVTNSVVGANLLTLTSTAGIKIGDYILSDGANFERVKVTSVLNVSSGRHVKTAANISNSYDLTKTFLYRSNLDAPCSDFKMPLELFTTKEQALLPVTKCAAIIRHSELVDAEISATAYLCSAPQKRENILLGTGGMNKIFPINDANIDQDSLEVYIDGVPATNYYFETGNAYIQLTAGTDSTITASYEYGGSCEEIELAELETYSEGDHFITRFFGESNLAGEIGALEVKIQRLANIAPDEQPRLLHVAAAFGA